MSYTKFSPNTGFNIVEVDEDCAPGDGVSIVEHVADEAEAFKKMKKYKAAGRNVGVLSAPTPAGVPLLSEEEEAESDAWAEHYGVE